jgi:hypothetical protein
MNVLITEGQYDRLFLEQPDSKFSFGYNPWSKDPNNLRDAMKRQEEYNSNVFKFIDENKHGLLDIAAIGTSFIPVVGPFISIGIELGNAALYASEGDNYTAGLSLAFSLIPAGQLIRRIPAVKKLGRNGLALLLKKANNPKTVKVLSQAEKEVLEQSNKNSKWISRTATKELSKKVTNGLVSKMNLPQLVKFIYSFSKKYPKTFNITNFGLQFGGIWYSYDKLAEIYGLKNKSKEIKDKSKPQNSGPYTTKGDPYEYRVKNGMWETKGNTLKDWVPLQDNERAVKELDKRFPKARTNQTITKISKKKLEDEFNKNKEKFSSEITKQVEENLEISPEERHKQYIEFSSKYKIL